MPSPALQEIKLRVENLDEELSLLRSALEIVSEPVLVLSREKAFIKIVGRAEEMLGYSWKELQEMVFLDLVDLGELGKVRDGFDAMKDHPEVRLKTIVISRWGEKIPVELFGCLRGERFFLLLKDLRETVRFEEEWEKRKKELTEKIRERD